ncbi:MAG TPA: hypothetical protein ENI61_06270 [Ignavibacteria bacterium]|nr:hypothetical protein [Ignavibacteria bacterium]
MDEYIKNQIEKILNSEGIVKIKIISENQETKWMNISKNKLEEIYNLFSKNKLQEVKKNGKYDY